MSTHYRILQTSMCLNPDFIDRNLILVFMLDDKIEGVFVVPIPEWLVFRDPQYQYYKICHN